MALLGRESEFEAARAFLAGVEAGMAGAAVITGEPGIGKTSFARALLEEADAAGWEAGWTWCWATEEAPRMWAWAQAMISLGWDPAPDPAAGFTTASRHARDGSSPAVVVFDDAHGADEATLETINLCVRSLDRTRLGIVLTVCEEEVAPGSARARLLDQISRAARRIDLFGLDGDAVAGLLELAIGEKPPKLVVDSVLGASDGNPFLVKELGRGLARGEDLHRPDRSMGFKVPRGAHAVLARSLDRLSPEEVEVLGVASVIGRTFSERMLAAVVGRGADAMVRTLQSGVDKGVLRRLDSLGTYEFSHALLREALYGRVPEDDRRRLHLSIAEALAPDVSRLNERAHHLFKAGPLGNAQEAVEVILTAAHDAEMAGAADEAARHLYRAARLARVSGLDPAIAEEADERRASLERAPETRPRGRINGTFKRDGEFWIVGLGETTLLKHSKGMTYLARLLATPGRELHALDLVSSDGAGVVAASGDTGPTLDPAAKDAYKARLVTLEEEIDEATVYNDDARREKAEEEKRFLLQELGAAVGLGGRDRATGSAAERARVATTRAIRAALRRIAASHPEVAAHLDSSIHTGTFAAYRPDPLAAPSWDL